MKPIGGYFELADREAGYGFPHKKGILLNTGRNALEYILKSLGTVRKVYLPYYTCEVVLEPLRRLSIPWEFYHINKHFEMVEQVILSDGEYIILNNYLGIKDQYVEKMSSVYGERMIVDCAQAFFSPVINGVKCFYSARKYVGVSDGGVAYPFTGKGFCEDLEFDDSSSHSEHLMIRKEKGAEAGFSTYREDEEKLNEQPIRRMSLYTRDILLHINYVKIIEQRCKNYSFLAESLNDNNLLHLPDNCSFACPLAYPFMVESASDLRKKLIDNKVFVPKFWPNSIIQDEMEDDVILSEMILPLPIDQRYTTSDMRRIVDIINN